MRSIPVPPPTAALALILIALSCTTAAAKTVHVPGQHADLRSALEDTSLTHGDTILVAPGTYSGPGNRDLEYHGKDLVLMSTDGPLHTIIDAQGTETESHRGILFAPGQFGTTTRAAVLDGFTIRNGFMGTPTQPEKAAAAVLPGRDRIQHDLSGAGLMFRLDASATVRNCIVENCFSEFTGGGIGVEFGSNPKFESVTVRGCRAEIQGGGVTVETLGLGEFVNCVITGNSSLSGGGLAAYENTTLQGCVIADNVAKRGGGIDVSFPASVSIINTIIWNNCASDSGAQLYVDPAINSAGQGFLRIQCSAVDTLGVRDLGGVTEYLQANVFENPQFCESPGCGEAPSTAGHYTVRQGSPCLAAGNACNQLIGPNPNACSTAVEERSISRVKNLFR